MHDDDDDDDDDNDDDDDDDDDDDGHGNSQDASIWFTAGPRVHSLIVQFLMMTWICQLALGIAMGFRGGIGENERDVCSTVTGDHVWDGTTAQHRCRGSL